LASRRVVLFWPKPPAAIWLVSKQPEEPAARRLWFHMIGRTLMKLWSSPASLDLPQPARHRPPRSRLQPTAGPPLVVVAGCQSPSRALGFERWTRLVESWHGGRHFLIAASTADAAFADRLARRFDGVASRLEGDFPRLCQAIAQSQEILTMDGGAVHMASFFGVPTVAVFTSGRSRKWAPLAQGSRIIRRHDLPCQPCTKFGQVPPCPIQYQCLELRNFDSDWSNSE
jgi:ADP-heptose:LPS heptosyltransferase